MTSSPPTVLIATDGSDAAIAAAQRATQLFDPQSHVVLAVVVQELESPEADAGGFEGPLLTEEEAEEEWEHNRAEGEAELAVTAAALDAIVDTMLVPSDLEPARALAALAKRLDADVIVVGSSDKGMLRQLLFGSVGSHLIHHAPCPVLVVRGDHAPAAGEESTAPGSPASD